MKKELDGDYDKRNMPVVILAA